MLTSTSVPAPCSLQTFSRPPETVRSLAHAGQAPGAPPFAPIEDIRIESDSVIAHPNGKLRLSICNLDFDRLRGRMPEGVARGLPRDSIDIVSNRNIQLAFLAFH